MATQTLVLNEATDSRTGLPTLGRTHVEPSDILELPVINFAEPVANTGGFPIQPLEFADNVPLVQNIQQPQVDPGDILDMPEIAW